MVASRRRDLAVESGRIAEPAPARIHQNGCATWIKDYDWLHKGDKGEEVCMDDGWQSHGRPTKNQDESRRSKGDGNREKEELVYFWWIVVSWFHVAVNSVE